MVLYADDTLIFTGCTKCEECYETIKKDMDNINKWLKINKLKLNENKTKLMKINMQSNSSFGINNVVTEEINSIKYLVNVCTRHFASLPSLLCLRLYQSHDRSHDDFAHSINGFRNNN